MNESRESIDTLELLQDSFEIQEQKNVENISGKESSCSFETLVPDETNDSKSMILDQEILDQNGTNNEIPIMDLQLYKEDIEELVKNVELNNHTDDVLTDIETSDLHHLEPKLKAAWIKMRKLDKILEKVLIKEKQVKKETQRLIDQNRRELEQIRLNSEHKESKSEAENTAHFLSLSYVNVDDEMLKDLNVKIEPSTPVFKTQLPDIDKEGNSDGRSSSHRSKETEKLPKTNSIKSSNNLSSNKTNSSQKKNSIDSQNINNEKNFIKRNIQLAKDIGGVLSMTDEEKLRLNQLMIDIDDFDQEKNNKKLTSDDEAKEVNQTIIAEYDPQAVKLSEGDGFVPNHVESNRLKQIDSLLEITNSARSGSSRIFSSSYLLSKSKLSNSIFESVAPIDIFEYQKKEIKLNDDFDENEFGDKFIREGRITREQEQKLKLIDLHLQQLKMPISQSEVSSQSSIDDIRSISKIPLVDEKTIKELLEEFTSENTHIQDFERQKTLDTLIEEDSENGLAMNNFTKSEVRLNDFTIKSLIEQAKNEGIMIEYENNENQDLDSLSYYQEALSVVNDSARKTLLELNTDLDSIYYSSKENENKSNYINTSQVDNPYNIENSNIENINYSENKKSIFPSILLNDDERNEDGRNSSFSTVSINSSTTSLPKIDSRFLPKQK